MCNAVDNAYSQHSTLVYITSQHQNYISRAQLNEFELELTTEIGLRLCIYCEPTLNTGVILQIHCHVVVVNTE